MARAKKKPGVKELTPDFTDTVIREQAIVFDKSGVCWYISPFEPSIRLIKPIA